MAQILSHLKNLKEFLLRLQAYEKPILIMATTTMLVIALHQAWRKPSRPFRFHHATASPPSKQPAVPIPHAFRVWRDKFLEIEAPHDPYGLVRGIFLGDASALTEKTQETFREAGLSHLLAASGFNCWIVAVAFGLMGKILFSLLAPILRSGPLLAGRKLVTPLTQFCGAWLFWLWTDQSPPITRSVLTVSAKVLFEKLGLSVPFLRLLLIQYLGSLLTAPQLTRNASFQLTFGCLFGILIFPPLVQRWRPQTSRVGKALWDYFATGLGACLGTIPTTFIVFGSINFSSLETNWFAVPLVSFVIMPAALAVMLLVPMSLLPGANAMVLPVIHFFLVVAKIGASALNSAVSWWCDNLPLLQPLSN